MSSIRGIYGRMDIAAATVEYCKYDGIYGMVAIYGIPGGRLWEAVG